METEDPEADVARIAGMVFRDLLLSLLFILLKSQCTFCWQTATKPTNVENCKTMDRTRYIKMNKAK